MTEEPKIFIYEKDVGAENKFLREHIEIRDLYLEVANLRQERLIQVAESFKSLLADMHAKHARLVEYLLEAYGLEWVEE